ncbi:osteoclast-associated immunoglobulin-like receptor [Saccopteryx leptura]|uniref:osteoclast-associated immunoglobulin-like receptor n=1 Tax=Saccopteryx leptura TaxID=249018 RepID=UPI00339BE154
MALVLILQLLTLWPLCHTDVTSSGTQEARGHRLPTYSVPRALLHKPRRPIYPEPPSYPKPRRPIYPEPPSYLKPIYPEPPSYPKPIYPEPPSYPKPIYPEPPSYPKPIYPEPPSYPKPIYPGPLLPHHKIRPPKYRLPFPSVPPTSYPRLPQPLHSVPPLSHDKIKQPKPLQPLHSVTPNSFHNLWQHYLSIFPTSYPKPPQSLHSVTPDSFHNFWQRYLSIFPTSYPKPPQSLHSVTPDSFHNFWQRYLSIFPTSYPKPPQSLHSVTPDSFHNFWQRYLSIFPTSYPKPPQSLHSVPPLSHDKTRRPKPLQPSHSVPPASYPKPPRPFPSIPPNSYSKPRLEAQPAPVVTPGTNVTLTCRAPQPAWGFALFKSGETAPVLYRNVSTELAQFFLEEVTEAQGGSYHCRYRNPGGVPGVWSHPSDALELLVTAFLPRPSLVALPGPGDTVSLRCAGGLRNMSFALYRAGEEQPLGFQEAAEPWADFPLPGARAPGTYTCYYHTPAAPYVLSQRSEPLVISSDGYGSSDYTRGNLVRLGLAGLVLLCLTTLVVLDWRSWRGAPAPAGP